MKVQRVGKGLRDGCHREFFVAKRGEWEILVCSHRGQHLSWGEPNGWASFSLGWISRNLVSAVF